MTEGKTFRQIADIPDSFVVNDGVEVGIDNKIPLLRLNAKQVRCL